MCLNHIGDFEGILVNLMLYN